MVMFGQAAGGHNETLEGIKAAHIASRQAIETCACKVDFTLHRFGKSPTSLKLSANYLRSRDVFRIRQTSEVGTEDIVYEHGVARSANEARNSAGNIARGGAILPAEEYPNIHCDPWAIGLLLLPVPNSISFATFEDFLSRGASIRRIESRQDSGHPVVAVELSYDRGEAPHKNEWEVVILFDPRANYLIRKIVLLCNRSADRTRIRRDYEVLEFAEPMTSVFFPKRVAAHIFVDDQLAQSTEATLTDIRLNAPLASEAFRLKYVRGTTMEDRIKGIRYRVDVDGTPISVPETALPTPNPPGLPEKSDRRPKTETKEEGRSNAAWLFAISLGFLALAGCLGYLRRRTHAAT